MRPHFLLILFFLPFLSCEFELDGKYVNEIEIKDPTAANINIKDLNDTVYVIEDTRIQIDVSEIKNKIYDVFAYADGKEVYISKMNSTIGPTLYLTIPGREMRSGTYMMTLTVIAHTESGSLLDELGSEFYEYEYFIPLVVDRDPPIPVKNLKASIENGYLKLTWDQYERINFSYFRLVRRYPKPTNSSDTISKVWQLDDRATTSFVDSSFMGMPSNYRIDVTSANLGTKQGPYLKVNNLFDLNPRAEIKEDGKARIEWDPNPFYNSIEQVDLTDASHSTSLVFEDWQSNDYTTDYEIDPFRHYFFTIKYKSKLGTEERHSFTITNGEKINDNIFNSLYSPFTDTYFAVVRVENESGRNEAFVREYAITSATHLKEVFIQTIGYNSFYPRIALSQDGKILVALKLLEDILYLLDIHTLHVIKEIDLNSIFGSIGLNYYTNMTITNDSLLYITSSKKTYSINLQNLNSLVIDSLLRISPNGNYVSGESGDYTSGVFRLDGEKNMELLYEFPSKYAVGSVNEKYDFFDVTMDDLIFYRLSDGQELKRFSGVTYSFDEHSGILFIYNKNTREYGLIDLNESFEVYKTFKPYRTSHNVINGMLLTQSGKTTTYVRLK